MLVGLSIIRSALPRPPRSRLRSSLPFFLFATETDASPEATAQLSQEAYNHDVLLLLVERIGGFEFEVRSTRLDLCRLFKSCPADFRPRFLLAGSPVSLRLRRMSLRSSIIFFGGRLGLVSQRSSTSRRSLRLCSRL